MRGGNLVFAPGAYDNAISRPSGYAWASIDDLGRFVHFLLRGNPAVLSEVSLHAMQTAQVNTLERLDLNGYGYGLAIVERPAFPNATNQLQAYPDAKLVWHGGEIPGYRALIATLPRQGFGYAVLINGDGINPGTDPVRCFQVVAVETLGKRLGPASPLPDPEIQRARFPDYVGEYGDRIDVAGRAIVTLAPDGDLRIRFPKFEAEGPPYDPKLYPTTRDNFAIVVGGTVYRLTGIRDASGTVKHLRARLTVLTRITED
jgi:CubicO group peptidase (beta-lactamase class C family)